MPTNLVWDEEYSGGNCGDSVEIDAQGTEKSGGGCESSSHGNFTRKLTTEQRTRFVDALDRLRRSSLWSEGNGHAELCGDGYSLRVVERSGEQRERTFCGDPRSGAEEKPKVPREVRELINATRPWRE